MSSALLEIRQLRASYGEAEVLHGIDLAVSQGEFVCIIGANTAGKSTILRSISRLVPRSSGIMRFGGADLTALAAHEIPALGIAHVPEGRQIFPDMTVEENLLLGAFTARKASDLPARIEDVLGLFPRLRERFGQLAGTLSGGEQQMVAVGRALMLRPTLLLLDEPSHGLAPKVVEEMHDAFKTIHETGHLDPAGRAECRTGARRGEPGLCPGSGHGDATGNGGGASCQPGRGHGVSGIIAHDEVNP